MPAVVTERDGAVLVVTLNRPDRLNAIDTAMQSGLDAAWMDASDDGVRAIVLTGAGRGFCAGADLRAEPEAAETPATPPSQYLRYNYNPGMLALVSLRKPVIAAVNGAAAGAGLGLALAADIRIVAPEATFVPSFLGAGLIPDMGVTFLAVRAVGYTQAFDWLTGSVAWTGADAVARGLANELVDSTKLLSLAIERAHRFAAMPQTALGLTKVALTRAYRSSLAEQLELENEFQNVAITDPDRITARARAMAKITNDASQSH